LRRSRPRFAHVTRRHRELHHLGECPRVNTKLSCRVPPRDGLAPQFGPHCEPVQAGCGARTVGGLGLILVLALPERAPRTGASHGRRRPGTRASADPLLSCRRRVHRLRLATLVFLLERLPALTAEVDRLGRHVLPLAENPLQRRYDLRRRVAPARCRHEREPPVISHPGSESYSRQNGIQ
jgi:hypothetical protein